jgi:2-keto-4-pentenoate hydratase/2-oxohepta-3-ene-1,7-dioic acid hydratase in catechol pathway
VKICQYDDNQAGLIEDGQIYPLGRALVSQGLLYERHTMVEVVDALANNPRAKDAARDVRKLGTPRALKGAKLLSPISNPGSFWCAAANYRAHQHEMIGRVGSYDYSNLSKHDLMAEFFLKPTSCIIGPGETVVLPAIQKHTDFECELCAVIGKPARKVSEDNAMEHVFGYCMAWDFSMREPWGKDRHNTRNVRKGCDTFGAVGPWIITADEIPDPQNLGFHVELNGKKVMESHTSDMVCSVREQISFLSGLLTLRTGDLLSTGTPAGVAQLAHGDHLVGVMEGIGSMDLRVVADGAKT